MYTLHAIHSLEVLQITRIKDFEDVGKLAKSDQYFSQVRDLSTPDVWRWLTVRLDKYNPTSLSAPRVHALPTKTRVGGGGDPA